MKLKPTKEMVVAPCLFTLSLSSTYLEEDIGKAHKDEQACEGESTVPNRWHEPRRLGLWFMAIRIAHLVVSSRSLDI